MIVYSFLEDLVPNSVISLAATCSAVVLCGLVRFAFAAGCACD